MNVRRAVGYDASVNLHIEHDATLLSKLSGAPKPACDSLIIKHGSANVVLAAALHANPLGGDWLADLDAPASRMLTWSGTLGHALFEPDPRTWMKPGKEALARFCDEIAPQLRQHQRALCFQPHARHVLNDAPSCLTFLRERSGQGFEVAFAPASMLEPSMIDRLEEHLQRLFEGLGDKCPMVMLNDVQVVTNADGDQHCKTTALGEGLFPREVIRSFLNSCVPRDTPIVIDGRAGGTSIQRQIDWLIG